MIGTKDIPLILPPGKWIRCQRCGGQVFGDWDGACCLQCGARYDIRGNLRRNYKLKRSATKYHSPYWRNCIPLNAFIPISAEVV